MRATWFGPASAVSEAACMARICPQVHSGPWSAHSSFPVHHYLKTTRARLAVFAGKNSQKNQGLYFDYEEVDPDAAQQFRELEVQHQDEFAWAKRARKSEEDLLQRHQEIDRTLQQRRRRNKQKPQQSKQLKHPLLNQQEQAAKGRPAQLHSVQAKSSSELQQPSSASSVAATAQNGHYAKVPGDVQQDLAGAPVHPAAAAGHTPQVAKDSSMHARKQKLLNRMQGQTNSFQELDSNSRLPSATVASSPSASAPAQTPASAATDTLTPTGANLLNLPAVSAATVAAATSVSVAASPAVPGPPTEHNTPSSNSASLGLLQQLEQVASCSLPAQLSVEEQQLKAMIDSVLASSPATIPGETLHDVLPQSFQETDTLKAWLAELHKAGSTPADAIEEAMLGRGSLQEGLTALDTELADIAKLAAELRSRPDTGALASPTNDLDDEGEDDAVGPAELKSLELLKKTDPELYGLLKDMDEDDEDLEKLLDMSLDEELTEDELHAALMEDGEELQDASVQELLSRLGNVELGEEEQELQGELDEEDLDVGDVFDAIDEAELDDEAKLKARYQLASMFNAPDDMQEKAAAQVYDARLRGLTTTSLSTTEQSTQLLPKPTRPMK